MTIPFSEELWNESTSHIISTLILLVSILALRFLLINTIRKSSVTTYEDRRKWIVQVRNLSFFILVLGLIIIWAQELRNFAISLVAVAAAIAIAGKELILCALGGFYRASSRPFEIGDRIEVGSIRGDVLDHDLLGTKLFEVGPGTQVHQYTGRLITLPNSIFLTSPVLNENRDKYLLNTFSIPLKPSDPWQQAEKVIRHTAEEACAPFIDDAREYFQMRSRKEGLEMPSIEPRVTIQIPKPGQLNLIVRIPIPGLKKGRIEQIILRRLLNEIPLNPESKVETD